MLRERTVRLSRAEGSLGEFEARSRQGKGWQSGTGRVQNGRGLSGCTACMAAEMITEHSHRTGTMGRARGYRNSRENRVSRSFNLLRDYF